VYTGQSASCLELLDKAIKGDYIAGSSASVADVSCTPYQSATAQLCADEPLAADAHQLVLIIGC
jgi:hypothetical protein